MKTNTQPAQTGGKLAPAPPDDIRERLAETDARKQLQDASRMLGRINARLDTLEEWARRQVAEPWFDPGRQPAAPQEQAGHAFECRGGETSKSCAEICLCCVCHERFKDCAGAKP